MDCRAATGPCDVAEVCDFSDLEKAGSEEQCRRRGHVRRLALEINSVTHRCLVIKPIGREGTTHQGYSEQTGFASLHAKSKPWC